MLRWIALPLAMLCVGCASPEPTPTPAQTSQAFSLDGTVQLEEKTIRYVVPEDRCLLDPERPLERIYYDILTEVVGTEGEVFALFVACDELDLYRTDLQSVENFEHLGGYFYFFADDGAPQRTAYSRSVFATMMAAMTQEIDLEEIADEVAEKTGEVTADPSAQVEVQRFESTGHTEDAAFYSFATRDRSFGTDYPVVGAMAVTAVYGYPIGLILIHVTEEPAAAEAVDENIRALIDAFLDANPDSDT